jgi:hypothetical protein
MWTKKLLTIIDEITLGDLTKPGWIRMSIHPTTTNAEIEFVCNGIMFGRKSINLGFRL